MADQSENPKTIILALFKLLTDLYRLSPVWWVVSLMKNRASPPDTCAMVTDIFVLTRLIFAAILLILLPKSWILALFAGLMIIELFVAYLAHFLTKEFNSAGPGKTTDPVRTLLIAVLNAGTFTLLYAYLYRVFEHLGPFDAFYSSFGTIAVSGFSSLQFSQLYAKIVSCAELATGIFLMAFVLATIVSWMSKRTMDSATK